MIIEVRKIDREKWTIEGVDRSRVAWTFAFKSTTKIRNLGPEVETVPLSLLLLQDPDHFPIEGGQRVLVHWKPDPEKEVQLAVRLTPLEAK